MKLYASPYTCSRAVHIVLEELGLPVELHFLHILKGEGQSPEFLAINPLGMVPVLELDSGERLLEVQVILQYLADQHPQSGLAPAAGSWERYRLMQWLSFMATELHKSFYCLFFGDRIHPQPEARKALREHWIERLRPRWATISAQLGEQPYVLGEYSLVDAYLFTILGWARAVQLDLSEWPNLAEFSRRMQQRPAVARVVEKEK